MSPKPGAGRLKVIDLTGETVDLMETIELSEEENDTEATGGDREGTAPQEAAMKEANDLDVKRETLDDETVVEGVKATDHLEPVQEARVQHQLYAPPAHARACGLECTRRAATPGRRGRGAGTRAGGGSQEPEDWNRPYPCSMCGKRFMKPKHVFVHERDHCYYIKRFPCTKCDKRFNKTEDLVRHERTHIDKSYICNKCKKVFMDRNDLECHASERSCDFSCSACSAVFTRLGPLTVHVRRWHALSRRTYACSLCRKPFLRHKACRRHERAHDRAQPYEYSCALCHRAFKVPISLENHIRNIHGGENSYQCKICTKKFSSLSRLKEHVVLKKCDLDTQTGNHPYNCGICNAGFDCLSLFQDHARVHM